MSYTLSNDSLGGSSQWNQSGLSIYYNSGNVGIGSASPLYKLDVVGDINLTGTFRQNGIPYAGSQWTTSGTAIYYTTGNVGIGTNNPIYKLDVAGDINLTGTFRQNGSPYIGSQWTTSGTAIYYTTGNVGIGTATNLTNALNVNGTVSATSFSGAGTELTGTAASLNVGGTAGGLSGTPNITVGTVSATSFSGAGTGLTGTASSLTAGNATTAAACSGNAATATTAAACSGNSATATTATNQSGGTVSATTGSFSGTITLPGTGTCTIFAGTGDGGTFTTYNVGIRSWWGLAFSSYDSVVRTMLDTRTGNFWTQGSCAIGSSIPAPTYTLQVTGTIGASQDITAFTSDERLKTKIGTLTGALDKVCTLDTFTYTHNELARSFGFTDNRQYVGISAQQVQKIQPEVVRMAPFDADGEKSKSGEDYMTVQYERLVPLLIEALKEERKAREALEERVKILEQR